MTRSDTDDGLRRSLESTLSAYFQSPVKIDPLDRRPGAYASSFHVHDIDVELANGTRLALVLKSVDHLEMLPEARAVKPSFLFNPRREIEVYRQILKPHHVGSPTMYGVAQERGHDLLVLERVDGIPLWQIGDFSEWLNVARWLGQFHSSMMRASNHRPDSLPLVEYDESLYRLWPQRAMKNLIAAGKLAIAHQVERILSRYGEVVSLLTNLPRTIIHGEFHASNVLLRGADATTGRVCALDWEMAGTGPGLMDLADLSSGKWSESQRAVLADAYRSALSSDIVPSPELFETGLEACRFVRAMQWLGWSSDWTPPPQHAHDWAADALDAAGRLGMLA